MLDSLARERWFAGIHRHPDAPQPHHKGWHRRPPRYTWLQILGPLAAIVVIAASGALLLLGIKRPAVEPSTVVRIPGICVQPGCAPTLPMPSSSSTPAPYVPPGSSSDPDTSSSSSLETPDPSRMPVGRAAISSPASAAPTPAPTDPILEAPPPLPPVPTLTVPPCVHGPPSKPPKHW